MYSTPFVRLFWLYAISHVSVHSPKQPHSARLSTPAAAPRPRGIDDRQVVQLDFFILVTSMITLFDSDSSASVVRLLRVLRPLRLINRGGHSRQLQLAPRLLHVDARTLRACHHPF